VRRREFITLLGGAAVAVPVAAIAQRLDIPVVGFLSSLAPADAGFVMPAFHEGLAEAGLVEGRTVAIEYRWAEGRYEQLPSLAEQLVQRRVAVLAAISGTPAALAAKGATTTVPVVFAVGGDPVAAGLVSNLTRPEGNVTGVSFYTAPIVAKRLELARELVQPGAIIGLLVNPHNPPSAAEGKAVEAAAAEIGQPFRIFNASTGGQIDEAFGAMAAQRIAALIVGSDPIFFVERTKLIVLMARHALPTIFADREQAEAGGLISYGTSRPNAYRQAGAYVGRIVKGEKPGDLPVMLPTKFHLLVNLKTAKSLRIDIPPTLLARADQVIE
jgi:putative tryptophan/tyrosine transport system substrate-binding protein